MQELRNQSRKVKVDVHTHILPKDLPRFKEKYGYGEFRIPIRMPHAGARGASLDSYCLDFLERGVAQQGLLNAILHEGGHTLFNGSL